MSNSLLENIRLILKFDYSEIIDIYRQIKNFPDNSVLISNPKNNNPVLNGKINDTMFFMNVLFYGVLLIVLMIMIVASVVNYELMFRDKPRTSDEKDDYYNISENQNGRYFYAPFLTIMILIFFFGVFKKFGSKSKNLFYFF
jgi:hypothetical protein